MLGIILTGSRVVWVLTIILLIVEQFLNKKKFWLDRKFLGKFFLFSGIVMLVLGIISIDYRISDFVGGWDVVGLQKREMLDVAAIKMIKTSPLFGIGAGNFMVALPEYQSNGFYWMQPVHNILLLAWSEVGLLGIVVLSIIFKSLIFKLINKKNWWLMVIIGVTGMLDHYWLTLPQNGWLLAIILGVI